MTDDDRALLDFAAKWWQAAGNQHDAITAELGLTPTRYYQRLNKLLDDPAVPPGKVKPRARKRSQIGRAHV